MKPKRIVAREEWLTARKALLEKEKAHMRAGDLLAAERRSLPWLRIEKSYAFDTEHGRKTLADLFNGRSQLIVHHLMYAPEWSAACPGCSFQAEHIDGPRRHLPHHNVTILAVSRAPLTKILAYRARMGWSFEWVSSFGSEFNYDLHVSFTRDQIEQRRIDYNFGTITTDPRYLTEELPGLSVFLKDESGQIFLTYSTFARGLDMLLGAHHYLDLTPEGRNEVEYRQWPRRHDEYPR
ncbi:MAG TPA: thioredoxin family protein [Steroidobacteraceae bacterium]|nr:thioredoxin family protein [Steroidobacteraceae bacterium]